MLDETRKGYHEPGQRLSWPPTHLWFGLVPRADFGRGNLDIDTATQEYVFSFGVRVKIGIQTAIMRHTSKFASLQEQARQIDIHCQSR